MIGNPFACSLDAGLFQSQNSGVITGALYFWDDDYSGGAGWTSAQDYAVYNVVGITPRFDPSDQNGTSFNGYIAAGQSFFVEKISNGSALVSFSNTMRSGSNNDKFFKQRGMNKLWLGIITPNGIYNETLIAFGGDATDSLDLQLDATKMKGNSEIAFGTKLNDDFFAIQSFAPVTSDKVIPLALDVGTAGQHEIRLMHLENFDETMSLVLEDRMEGTFQNLRSNSSYFFNATAAMDIDRFYLHFTAPLEVDIFEEGCEGLDGVISLYQPGTKSWEWSLTDEDGHVVASNTSLVGAMNITGLSGGIYQLALEDEFGYIVNREIEIESLEKVISEFEVSAEAEVAVPVHFQNKSTGADSYKWNFGDGTSLQDVAEPVHTYRTPGSYEVRLIAMNDDCIDETSRYITVTKVSTGIQAFSGEGLHIGSYGNHIFLAFENPDFQRAQLLLFDKVGRKILARQVNTSEKQVIDVSNIGTGFYFVKVITPGYSQSGKVFLTDL